MSDVNISQPQDHQDPFEKELCAWLRNDHLHLILLPTEQCNFRCTYCYEDFSIGRMSAATVEGVKRLIERRSRELGSLSVSWFGGEPLLARGVVEDISEHIVRTKAAHPDLQVEGDMTTNGYLLDAQTVERLSELGIRLFQISLDGPEVLHDRTRVRANGGGSFHQLWRNLVAIRDGVAPINVLLRIHLTPDNVPHMREFLVKIRETFLDDKRFQVLLKPVEHLGGPNDRTMAVLPQELRSQVLPELEKIVCGEQIASERLFSAPQVCYASRPNSLVIRADGAVGKCTVALTDPANAIGRLRLDGTLEINNARLRPWLRGWLSRDWAAVGCPYAEMPRG
jgi:uncharacterized protein